MKKIHVYAHTHWDYEWYFTSSESIIQLIYHMDEVISALKEGILKTYLLDSQVSILEEYLLFMPEKTETIRQLVKEGRLQIGPWYTQSDELIIAGESMARNLWYGMKYAAGLGKCLKIGYLPDSFGQSKDMPKLYQGFGIHDALFWRGVPDDICSRREFRWRSSDGSEVLTCHIRDGYFYGGNLIYTDDVNHVEERIQQGAVSEHQLLSLGGDQRYVDFNLHKRLAYYNERSTHDFHYIESDLVTFFDELRKEENLPCIEGEFIDASVSKIHHSIYSSRYDHKELNDRIERRIIYQLEPFMVMQMAMCIQPKTSVLEKLWKKLLLNHAHDSACGCNSDQTNQSILQRLIDCDQMSSMMLDYQVRKLSESLEGVKENDLIIYNTLPYTRTHTQILHISTRYEHFIICDDHGAPIPYDLYACERVYSGSIRKDEKTYDPDLYYYETQIMVSLKLAPTSVNIFHIEETTAPVNIPYTESIENDYYHIRFIDGKLNLFCKSTGEEIHDFIYVEDGGDDGDTYDYSYPEHDHIAHLHFDDAQVSCSGDTISIMKIKGKWILPENLKEREAGIVNTSCAYQMQITLDHSDCIGIELQVDNQAIEHRMRAIVRTHIESDESIADTPYGTIRRSCDVEHMKDWKEYGYREEPTPIYPMLHHVTLKQETGFASCFVKGIKEYEILNHQDIALTLFRSVPWLGKPDLKRRPGIASGNEFRYIETPDSCLKKTLHFAFSIVYGNMYDACSLHKEWMNDANDYLYYQIQEINRFTNTQKYFVTHPYKNRIKPVSEIVSLDDLQHAVFSTMQPLEDKHYALRIYNSDISAIKDGRMKINNAVQIHETDFLQNAVHNDLPHEEGVDVHTMRAEEIRTYEIITK